MKFLIPLFTYILVINASASIESTDKLNQDIAKFKHAIGKVDDVAINFQDYVQARDVFYLGEQGIELKKDKFLKLTDNWLNAWGAAITTGDITTKDNFETMQIYLSKLLDNQDEIFNQLVEQASIIQITASEGIKLLNSSPKISSNFIEDQPTLITDLLENRKIIHDSFSESEKFYVNYVEGIKKIRPLVLNILKLKIKYKIINSGLSSLDESILEANEAFELESKVQPVMNSLKIKLRNYNFSLTSSDLHFPGVFQRSTEKNEIAKACHQSMQLINNLNKNNGFSNIWKSQVKEMCKGFNDNNTYSAVPTYLRVYGWATSRYNAVMARCMNGDPIINCELVRNLYKFIAFSKENTPLKSLSEKELRDYEMGWNKIFILEKSTTTSELK